MIVEVWQRVMDLAKTGTSGQDTQDEFNGKVNSAQKALQSALIQAMEVNQEASDALSWLKVPSGPLLSDSNGKITMPADYLHLDSVEYISTANNRYPATKVIGSIGLNRTSPIRKPSLPDNEISYYFKNGGIYVMPEQANIKVDFLYYKKVPNASIVLTATSTDEADLVQPSIGVDFGWPDSVFNLLVYFILEQLGIELKEQWLMEYSQFGIARDMIKNNA